MFSLIALQCRHVLIFNGRESARNQNCAAFISVNLVENYAENGCGHFQM